MVSSRAENNQLKSENIISHSFNNMAKLLTTYILKLLLTWYQFFMDFLVIIDEGTLITIGRKVAPIAWKFIFFKIVDLIIETKFDVYS